MFTVVGQQLLNMLWYVLCCLWDGAYKRLHAGSQKK